MGYQPASPVDSMVAATPREIAQRAADIVATVPDSKDAVSEAVDCLPGYIDAGIAWDLIAVVEWMTDRIARLFFLPVRTEHVIHPSTSKALSETPGTLTSFKKACSLASKSMPPEVPSVRLRIRASTAAVATLTASTSSSGDCPTDLEK